MENNKIMLWGLSKISKAELANLEDKNNNPRSTIKTKKVVEKPSKKVEPRFDVEEDYGIQDLPFLRKEADRLEKEVNNASEEDYDELLDLQDKILELINTLEEMDEKFGTGIGRSVLEPTRIQYEDIDGDTSDDEYGRGIEEPKVTTKKKTPIPSKVRNEKGSEKALEIGRKLAEARRKKREESGQLTKKEILDKKREEKAKVKGDTKKPWYYIGLFPKGYREASEDEAIKNHKVGLIGLHVVDPLKYEFYTKYGILLSYDLTDSEITIALLGIPKKIQRSFKEIEILGNKLENPKYSKKELENYKDKLKTEEQSNKNLIKAFNWIYKLFCKRKGQVYVKKVFKPPKVEVPEVVIKKEIITEHKVEERPKMPKSVEKEIHKFENAFGKIAIPKKAFNGMILKPKYAKKLFEKKIILHPHHYESTDVNNYFYNKIGSGIGSRDAQKLISAGYKSDMVDIDGYHLDKDLSNDRARVYKNEKTGKVYVVHRGTKETLDWGNNAIYGLSPEYYKYTDRYKKGKDVQEKAIKKYGNIDVIGHSQGAKIAELASRGDKRVKDVITYNRPVGLLETMTPLDKNVTDIRSSYDPVSILAPYQKGNKPIVMENSSWNPLSQHSSSALKENPNFDIGHLEGEGIVHRKPDPSQRLQDIVQSVVFEKPKWTIPKAKTWLHKHGYYFDMVDDKPTQLRFRQYNPEDLRDRHFISKKLKNSNILLIISVMNNRGSGIMLQNYEFLTPKEHKELEYKQFFEAQTKHQKANERLEKEKESNLKAIKKATTSRVTKGSKEAKEKMAKVRASKKT